MNGPDFYHSERIRRRGFNWLEVFLGAVLILLILIAIGIGSFQL